MAVSKSEMSPLTGILKEENVVIDFGKFEGKSVMEINDEFPEFYDFLLEKKDQGNFFIRRAKDKSYRLYIQSHTLH